MSKIKTSLKEPTIDNRLLDDRGPTWELLQKVDYVQSDSGTICLRVQQSPIERAVARGTISEQHGRAADKFLTHWERGGCIDFPTNWKSEPAPGGKGRRDHLAGQEIHINDREQLAIAVDAIHREMDLSGQSQDAIKLMFLIVCNGQPFEPAGQQVFGIRNPVAAASLAIRYVKSALRVLSFEWNIS